MRPLKVLSLFDGISCGRVALERAGIPIGEYAAFEIDKYAMAISRFHYPDIKQYGDVMTADFSMFQGFDLVMGGSPCTFWSSARFNREKDKSGMGWLLFSKFLEAVSIVKPKWYFYENVASMPASIKEFISEEFESNPILINSTLVSAQHRRRFYWTNIPGIEQPEDRGILIKDILENEPDPQTVFKASGAMFRTREDKLGRFKRLEVRRDGKSHPLLTDAFDSMVCTPIRVGEIGKGGQGQRIYSVHGKTICMSANGGGSGGKTGLYRINLPDGDYIVRKLTTLEAERCQTLPDGYTAFGADENGNPLKISNTQRYKCIGNGWTVEAISHMFSYMKA